MNTLTSVTLLSPASVPVTQPDLQDLLAPVFEIGASSTSLIATRHKVHLDETSYEIPKFLLLGQRGGGRPLRVGLFAGFDHSQVETTVALTRLLLQFELIPALARDYALFAYPIVDVRVGDAVSGVAADLTTRGIGGTVPSDVQFFRSELQRWSFDGLISLRSIPQSEGFYATTRSELLGKEVVLPAIQSISGKLPVQADPIRLRPADRAARLADYEQGKLTGPIGVRPYPFEFELFAPGNIPVADRITGLFLIVQELLRNYRRLISHAQDL
ncbi:MAG: hypothetical protein EOP84_07765 [Verrucomicrobiaceae bacterium]|nr:MAG: hypothetical protein EOP84_07765 [Verrucomicrobiaceae bacterium]